MVDYIGYWIFTKEDQCAGTVFYIPLLLFATQECFDFSYKLSNLFYFLKIKRRQKY
jgi:hypothetical protein